MSNQSAIEQLPEVFAFSFMKPVIYHAAYYMVETSIGTEYVPQDVCRKPENPQDLGAYCEGEPEEFELRNGWLARMSAPGYMDCTDWTAHETEEEAAQYLIDQYGGE